ncbi:MAG: vanadium-dependent haloperoxidase [Gemmatimonadaceae bacterium]
MTLAAAALTAGACDRPARNDPTVVSAWMQALYGTVRVERVSPPVGSRFVAYAATALYSGFAVTDSSLKPLSAILSGFPALPAAESGQRYDGNVIAVSAERTVLDSLLREALPTTQAQINRLADSLTGAQHTGDDVRRRSIALGRDIGLRIVSWAHGDGFDSTRTMRYSIPKGPGLWINDSPANWFSTKSVSGASVDIDLDNPNQELRPTNRGDRDLILNRPKTKGGGTLPAVNMAGVTEPYWGTLRPFAIERWDACPIDPAPTFGTTPDAPLYQEAKVVHDTRVALTPEQKEIALYWADNPSESATPSGHWTAIASQLVSQRGLSGADAVRATTITAVAVADAFISAWGYKFRVNLIRPRTYIRAVIDSTWEPFLPTPPFPEFIAGHSTVSASAATALTDLLGTFPFDDSTSMVIGHKPRHFASLLGAAQEAAQSRVYGGMHYPAGSAVGAKLGRCLGNAVAKRFGLAPATDAK